MASVWACVDSVHYFSGLALLTEDTSMITVSSCGVKLEEVLLGLGKKAKTLDIYTCTFVTFLNIYSFITLFIFSFYLGCNVAASLVIDLNAG